MWLKWYASSISQGKEGDLKMLVAKDVWADSWIMKRNPSYIATCPWGGGRFFLCYLTLLFIHMLSLNCWSPLHASSNEIIACGVLHLHKSWLMSPHPLPLPTKLANSAPFIIWLYASTILLPSLDSHGHEVKDSLSHKNKDIEMGKKVKAQVVTYSIL